MVVGLGNPTQKYTETRHNAGFWFLDRLTERYSITLKESNRFQGVYGSSRMEGEEVIFLKPLTYMNHSGRSVAAVLRYFKISPDNLLVAHDELDFPAGVIRLKKDGGHGGHNGLRDIVAALGCGSFYRLRIGIDRPNTKEEVVQYVLNRPSRSDRDNIEKGFNRVQDIFLRLLQGDFQEVMNSLHSSSSKLS